MISVLIGRERGRQLGRELTEAFAEDGVKQAEVMLYAKSNDKPHRDMDVQFTCEPDWAEDSDVLVEIEDD